jgi:hypothetical protein
VTVEPASAVPFARGSLSFAGEAGFVAIDGADGAAESSTYVTEDEQADTLPTASVAVTA